MERLKNLCIEGECPYGRRLERLTEISQAIHEELANQGPCSLLAPPTDSERTERLRRFMAWVKADSSSVVSPKLDVRYLGPELGCSVFANEPVKVRLDANQLSKSAVGK